MSCRRLDAPAGWNCWEHSCYSCPYAGFNFGGAL